jgi:hypothetical protein
MNMSNESSEQNRVERARAEVARQLMSASQILRDNTCVPKMPERLEQFGECVELVKRGIVLMSESRALLSDATDDLKGAHSDEARGGKETLNDAARSRLRDALASDEVYQRSLTVDSQLRLLVGKWDARRSRLARDFETMKLREEQHYRREDWQAAATTLALELGAELGRELGAKMKEAASALAAELGDEIYKAASRVAGEGSSHSRYRAGYDGG